MLNNPQQQLPATPLPHVMQVRASNPAWAFKLDCLISFWLLQPLWAALAWLAAKVGLQISSGLGGMLCAIGAIRTNSKSVDQGSLPPRAPQMHSTPRFEL